MTGLKTRIFLLSLFKRKSLDAPLKENLFLIIFFLIPLWLALNRIPYSQKWFFSHPELTLQHNLHKIYMAFYLLTRTYVNDVNVGRNILINSFESFFISSDKKKWNKIEEDRKNMEKENNTDKIVKIRYQI